MFDTMTTTKILGAICGSLLIFLLAEWLADEIYHSGSGGHGGDHKQAYVIEVDEIEETKTVSVEEDFDLVFASANLEKGSKVFSKCKACHKLDDGAKGTGPHLYGVVGRATASISGYGYSKALVELSGDWTPAALNGFLKDPKKYAPGTKMGFAGLKKIKDRANIIAFLNSIGDQ
ncbi:cytochrome c family protein [Paracoccaceae bacterium]|nr:cytochrome c family protein [Paracoccaceae bacterium]MDC0108116.1 cytochrome c family protein [Paracoccaceae bacterium]